MRLNSKRCCTTLAWLCTGIASTAAIGGETVHPTATPIRHLVVIFQENVSFDHYFATYPNALNPAGEPTFHARFDTPYARTLEADNLLAPKNPNSTQPFRLNRDQAATCDQNHEYKAEQEALDGGRGDRYVETVGIGPSIDGTLTCKASDTMGYFDGNTVTALWNYALCYER
jgi:phospholipase C